MNKLTNNNQEQEEILLSLSDFKRICQKSSRLILWGALIGAILAACFSLTRPLKYTSEATFREKGKGESSTALSMIAMSIQGGNSKDSTSLIKSRKIMTTVVKKLNLQASIQQKDSVLPIVNNISTKMGLINQNLQGEYIYFTKSETSRLLDRSQPFEVKEISYEEEIPLFLRLVFLSDETFLLLDSQKKQIIAGKIGRPISFEQADFIIDANLDANSQESLKGQAYELSIYPSQIIADRLIKDLKIKVDFDDKSFMRLFLTYPSRQGVSQVLNGIMEAYQEHLISEHHRIVANQIVYLKQRQEIMDNYMSQLIMNKADHLSTQGGHLDLLLSTREEYNKKLISINLESKHLKKSLETGGGNFYNTYSPQNHLIPLNIIVEEIQECKLQCASIELALENQSLKEKAFQNPNSLNEFQGIDLDTARQLYISYSQELNKIEADITQNQFILQQIQNPQFELSSLTTILKDPVSKEIVSNSSVFTQAINDSDNRTSREIQRLEQELIIQKNFLTSHLQQIVELLQLHEKIVNRKIENLLRITLALIQQNISIKENHITNLTHSRINNLDLEQEVFLQQQQEIKQDIEKIPHNWVTERWIELKLKSNGKILEQLGNMIESKNIADNLDVTLSAPFDLALSPVHANPPHILIYILLGAITGSFLTFCFTLMNSVMTGIEATEKNLSLLGQHVSGSLSKNAGDSSLKALQGLQELPENDLAMLRNLSAYLFPPPSLADPIMDSSRAVLLLRGNGVDYSTVLAEILVKRGLKILLMDISFDQPATPEELPGLLQYLEGDVVRSQLKITPGKCYSANCNSGNGYNIISSGGISQFGIELLETEAFKKLLDQLLKEYDYIIAMSNFFPVSAEAKSLMEIFSHAAITLSGEKLDQLKFYCNLANSSVNNAVNGHAKGYSKITFLLC